MNKKANILTENVVFIILNLVFFSMLIIFIFIQTSSVALLEQKTAKQIALIVDAARPGTEISLNIREILEKATKDEISQPIVIDNENNLVAVKLSEKGYYEYFFFNDVNVVYEIDKINGYLEMSIE